MPLWQFFSAPGALGADERLALAQGITKLYTEGFGLPNFYTNVLFHEVADDSFLIGGAPRADFVRITVDHIARNSESVREQFGLGEDVDLGATWLQAIKPVLDPQIAERGLHWELHVDETPKEYWYIDGQIPPEAWSDEEADWSPAASEG